jgi:signal transduction histidine kinase/CheY-like chemotaxis protein/chemotaxis methyl-accepting protein methylase
VIRRDAQMVRLAAFDHDQSSGGAAQFTCSVLIVGSNAAELVDDLLADLSKIRHRQADSGPIVLWQVEPSDGRLELLGPAEGGTAEDDQVLALSRRGFVDVPDSSTLAPGVMYFVPPHRRIWFEGQVVRIGQRSLGEDRPIDRLLLSLAEGWGHHSVLVFALQSTADGECGLRIIRAVGGIALQRSEYPSAKRLRPQDFRSDLKSDPRPDGADANERASISERAPSSEFPIASEDRRRNALRMARVFSVPAHLRTSAQRACEVAVQQARERGRLRVWMPACKAGGMTYAVAMLLAQAAERCDDPPKMVIFGTDDDELALSVARAGRFSARAALGMDPELRGRYTFDEGEVIRVSETLRESCVFSRHELLRDPPMARMALVVCHRVFEGVSSARRSELIEGFHYSLRHGGILLALDHVDLFPDQLFERFDAGFFRARPEGRRMPLTRRFRARLESSSTALAERPPAPLPESPPWGPAKTSSEPILPSRAERLPVGAAATALEPVLQSIVLPLLVCDAELRVSFFNLEAENAFHLSPADAGGTLLALAPRLPGGVELVEVARGAASAAAPRELSARSGRHLYRVRIAVLLGQSGRGFSIAFNDVTELEAARVRADVRAQQHAAIARISELAFSSPLPNRLYEAALSALFGHRLWQKSDERPAVTASSASGVRPKGSAWSAGIIVELAGQAAGYEVMAARGLGVEPLRTLRGMGDATALLDAVVAGACIVSQGGERAVWAPSSTSAEPYVARSARARRALATLGAGMGWPIIGEGVVLGVVALYGRHSEIDDDQRHFVQSIANVLGGALVRHRTQRRLALDFDVSRLLSGASDLNTVGLGLRTVLGNLLPVSTLEIWASGAEPEDWIRLFPAVEGERPERPWPKRLFASPSSGRVMNVFSAEAGELLVPIEARELSLCVLRLCGEGLRVPDDHLAEDLSRIGCVLAAFLERLRILEVSRQNEASFGQKAAELEALYSTLPVGVSIHDRQGLVRHVNRHLSLLGAPSASGSDPLERLYAEEVPRWIARVLESGEPIHDVELFVTEGERRLSWLCNFAPIRDAAGTVHGASAVVQDITPLKRVEATLREADQQKDDFLAMLGHELRNPMAAIRNATELLSRIEQPTPQLMRLQSIFDRQTLQTTKLIDGLLDVARVARGKVELELAPVPVVDLVRQVVDDRRQQFERRELELHFPEHEVWVNADRVRLVQILDNLISNALKFTVATGHISVEVRTQGERGSIRIGDDGAGIEPELLPRIFEPFRQGQVTMARTQGLGLGLALAKGLVDLHGFRLAARSAGPGQGACFEIEFPLTPAEERRAPESRISSRPLDLLLVEDNVDIAETLAELLEAAGHHIEVEGSAEDALESLRRRRPDVMLCDIGLPGMDGLELATRLRADPAFSDLKLVAMTGFGDSSTQERIRRAGFDRYLVKPVQLEALRECLLGVASVASSRAHRRG